MNNTYIYPPDAEAKEHVFEPLRPVFAGGHATTGYPQIRQYDLEEVQRDAYERGLKEGKELVDRDLIRVVHGMAQAVNRWKAEEDSLREAMKHDVLRLILAIARQVVMAELKSHPEAIGEIVRKLLEEAEGRKVFSVHLHPDDVKRLAASPLAHLLEGAEIAVHPSEEMSPGGCILETSFGRLDARLETRIQELAESLLAGQAPGPATPPAGISEPAPNGRHEAGGETQEGGASE